MTQQLHTAYIIGSGQFLASSRVPVSATCSLITTVLRSFYLSFCEQLFLFVKSHRHFVL